MAQVYGAGGKTQPKRGRNGTGSYWPEKGTPLYQHAGNVFPGINVNQAEFIQLRFGDPSRAGIASVVGQDRTASKAIHPNSQQYNVITLVKAPAMIVSSSNEQKNLQPVPPAIAILTMPHERNTNSASGTKKKPLAYRSAFGAVKSMPVDSAFVRNPTGNYKHTLPLKPQPATEAVFQESLKGRTFAKAAFRAPTVPLKTPPRVAPASFVSRGNHWFDPHNSFIAGATTVAGHGVGRWAIVKKGVISQTPINRSAT